jgi:hypothetical protein
MSNATNNSNGAKTMTNDSEHTIRKTVCDCGNDVYHKAYNEETGETFWKCGNCFAMTPRKVYLTKRRRRLLAFSISNGMTSSCFGWIKAGM